MGGLADRVPHLVIAWAVLSPLPLSTVAALVWGRVALSPEEVKRALAWTLGASVLLAFPATWAIFAYCAGFNPQPTTSAVMIGGLFAVLLLPVYSALVACVAFEFAVQSAQSRGALRRSLAVRAVAGLFLAAVVILGLVALGTSCFLAAGPKAMG
jgi:hypothetical protein